MSEAPKSPILPFLRIGAALTDKLHDAILGWTLANQSRFAPSRLAGDQVDPRARQSLSLRDLGTAQSDLEAHILAVVPDWIKTLRITPFDVSCLELEIVAYNDGGHFTLHSDTYTRDQNARGDRMLSAVYYYHARPKGFEGGHLRLHRLGASPGDAGIDIAPEDNSLVVLPSWAPHEVMPVTCASGRFADSRFAINCWIYRSRD
jgi:SM-20-related protein